MKILETKNYKDGRVKKVTRTGNDMYEIKYTGFEREQVEREMNRLYRLFNLIMLTGHLWGVHTVKCFGLMKEV